MRLGLVLPTFGDLRTRENLISLARLAEDVGLNSVWLSEHIVVTPELFDPFGDTFDTLLGLGYIAGATTGIQLGTSIVILPLHDPVLLAKQAGTLHELSGGRLRLGLAAGWCREEFELLGVDFDRRGALMDEYVGVLRHLLSDDDENVLAPGRSALQGIQFAPKPTTKLPILIGGHARPALQRAAQFGDGWHGVWLEPDEMGPFIEATRGRSDKRDFEISLRIDVSLLEDDDGRPATGGLVGSSEEVLSRIGAYQEAGVDELVLDFMDREHNAVQPLPAILRQLERIGSELLATT